MANFTEFALDRGLASMFGPGVTVGLLRDGEEIEDPGYRRQAVTFGRPETVRNGIRTLSSANDLRFGPWLDVAPEPIEEWGAFSQEGELLASGEIRAASETDRQALRPPTGHELVIRARGIMIGLG